MGGRFAARSPAETRAAFSPESSTGDQHGRRFYRPWPDGSGDRAKSCQGGTFASPSTTARAPRRRRWLRKAPRSPKARPTRCRRPVVITMLADDHAVEGIFFGDGNGLAAMGQGALHISMSTISVALSDRLAQAHRNAGQMYVAAPVFGRPEAAAAAKLFVVAAGAWSRRSRAASHCSTPSANEPLSSATSRPRRISSSSAATSCSRR